ncbi:hypothetical protein JVU11DRAFT_3023 [Chiua virens]|nr:hypothetical protein JVU11DRAFT_3023 [Chiua virens]
MLRAPVRAYQVSQTGSFKLAPPPNLSRHMHHSSLVQPNTGVFLTQHRLSRRRQASHTSMNVAQWFHSTPRRQGLGGLVPLLGAFKVSTTIELARTAGRIALTLVPLVMLKNRWTKKILKHHTHFHPEGVSEEKKAALLKRVRSRTLITHLLLFIPAALLWLGILASVEQTPLTGRWRLIVLSPEEEDEIAAQLAGPKWYQAVTDILSNEGEGPPKLIPARDWRYQWVQDTLNKLESVIPMLQHERELSAHWLDVGPENPPLPPPAEYPLRPRPRGTDRMRRFSDTLCGRKSTPSAHVISGPPYSLLIADRPDAENAFSYGFGPDGACGIVVYSGFLDDILSKGLVQASSRRALETLHTQGSSWYSSLLGSLFNVPSTSSVTPSRPTPTEEQTTELAILLAHEVAHLLLSHHIETLSSGTIIVPAIVSMVADMARTLVFPVTMLFGPFFNDAIGQLGKVGSGHLTELGEYCTSVKQEVEADVVSARLLAYAGFDARKAVEFWERRQDAPKLARCSSAKCADTPSSTWNPARPIMGASHPVNEVRIEKLKSELVRWELEKRVAMRMRVEGKSTERRPNSFWALL